MSVVDILFSVARLVIDFLGLVFFIGIVAITTSIALSDRLERLDRERRE